LETKVRGTSLHINAKLINKVTGIPLSHALGTPFSNLVTLPSREELMVCFDPKGPNVWEESKNNIIIGWLQSPQRLLAQIVMQNIWLISRHNDIPLNRACLIFAIINRIPFCMCKHIVVKMIKIQEDSQIALHFGGLVTKILKKKLTNIPVNEPKDMPHEPFRKITVMKSNAQLHRLQAQDDLVPPAPSVASSSQAEPSDNDVLSMLPQITDRLLSMDTRMTNQFQSIDNRLISFDDRFLTIDQRMQLLEANVAQIKINVRNTLCYILPEDQRDQVP
jgi:hypothetical protein